MNDFLRTHGGPNASEWPLRHDFSSNGNACGPCPMAWAAVQAADSRAYPDPAYTALRKRIGAFHGVAAHRIVVAASASEAIFRLTAAFAQAGGHHVALPLQSFGNYAHAAAAWGLAVERSASYHPQGRPTLAWACEPASPTGQPQADTAARAADPQAVCVLDLAYAPLRLHGMLALEPAVRDALWQLWTPNKALGLTGVRGAYLIASTALSGPFADLPDRLARLAPSWPVGAHGVALLDAWCGPLTQDWLEQSRDTLRIWSTRQRALLSSLGWTCHPSDANFFCCEPHLPPARLQAALAQLRATGIALRDAASFGLPGQVRVAVQPPAAQDALAAAWPHVVHGTRLAA